MAKNSSARSRYDELHDKYHRILTTKAGTRYEQLAALVFKALEAESTVVHDLDLRGADPAVKHQIDVTIDKAGEPRRIIIECKDFDISESKVGLGIVRNFRSVIEDTGADEGIVISCNGFTEDAMRYAASKGIKLAVLRLFEDRDMDGRIARILVNLVVQLPTNPVATVRLSEVSSLLLASEFANAGISNGVGSWHPVVFDNGEERIQFIKFLNDRIDEATELGEPRLMQLTIPSNGWKIKVVDGEPIPFDAIDVSYEVVHEHRTIEVVSQRVAELILSGFGDDDVIVFGDQIVRHKIDQATGKVLS